MFISVFMLNVNYLSMSKFLNYKDVHFRFTCFQFCRPLKCIYGMHFQILSFYIRNEISNGISCKASASRRFT